VFGRALVGLSWAFDPSAPSGFWSHHIEPDPFVPTKLNSNCFWIGIGASAIGWVIVVIHSILSVSSEGFLLAIVSIVIAGLYVSNFVVFFKIQQISSRESVETVRVVLLGNNSAFPEAGELSSSDSDETPKRKEEVRQPEAVPQKDEGDEDEIV
jgi:hypothetical protein